MKVTSIDLYSSNLTNHCSFSFRDPQNRNPYTIHSIMGLDAEEITPTFYGQSNVNGNKYFDLSLKKRVIVIKSGLNPEFSTDQSYSTLRDSLYRLISSSRTGSIELRFKNDDVIVALVTGFITKLESDNFSNSPNVTMTIECDDPLLRAPNAEIINVADLDPKVLIIQDEKSTAPHGLRLECKFVSDLPYFLLSDPFLNDYFFVIPTTFGGFKKNDVLKLSSERNNRYLTLTRGEIVQHIADTLYPNSVWPMLFPGENTMNCSGSIVWTHLSYFPTYWGV